MNAKWFDEYGNLVADIPQQCVEDCSHAGECYEDVERWQKKLDFNVPRGQAIGYLAEFGAWPLESNKYDQGLNDKTDEDLARLVLWLACGDIKENEEWFSLMH